jgi:hypothetical protein
MVTTRRILPSSAIKLSLFAVILGGVLGGWLFARSLVQAAPILTTDKEDYFAAEIVPVQGAGFDADTDFDIPVIRPDGSIVLGDGSFRPGWDTIRSDGDGAFTYYYQLDGIDGTYEVRVYPAPWSGNLGELPVASMTFTDANISFNQCRNDTNNDNIPNSCNWTTGSVFSIRSNTLARTPCNSSMISPSRVATPSTFSPTSTTR